MAVVTSRAVDTPSQRRMTDHPKCADTTHAHTRAEDRWDTPEGLAAETRRHPNHGEIGSAFCAVCNPVVR